MAKVKPQISITSAQAEKIRRAWDPQTQEWNYSIADIISILTDTIDPRNYWKALKNRLKNTNKELVTACNQLKMPSADGKFYMVDSANRHTMSKIIHIVSPYNVDTFNAWFDHIDALNSTKDKSDASNNTALPLAPKPSINFDEEKISTALEIPMDVFEEKDKIIIKFLAPGINPSEIFISISAKFLTIKGTLVNKIEAGSSTNKIYDELSFGQFYRKIELPNLADIDNVESTEYHGLIEIRIQKINQERERFLKIKSI